MLLLLLETAAATSAISGLAVAARQPGSEGAGSRAALGGEGAGGGSRRSRNIRSRRPICEDGILRRSRPITAGCIFLKGPP